MPETAAQTMPETLPDRMPVRRALLSVFSKEGIVDFARELAALGAEILSTGGTLRALREAGIEAREVSEHTGFPEMLDGRVKTLHPKIHGGLLGRRDLPSHREAMAEHGIEPIDLVCVHLYPFEETVADPSSSRQDIVEKIDIGGPSMLRSAAKNHDAVTVLCDPADYGTVLEELREGGVTRATRRRLAGRAFARTAAYDAAIAAWFASEGEGTGEDILPARLTLALERQTVLRYGENPHQRAALYRLGGARGGGLGAARVREGGKELSYNNYLDLDGAVGAVADLPAPAAVVVKHTNPCGAAVGPDAAGALERAWEGDPLSAFGSVIALNVPVDAACAEFLTGGGRFVEAVAAPAFEAEAVEILRTRPKWGKSVRLVEIPDLREAGRGLELRRIQGGILAMEPDRATAFQEDLQVQGEVPLPEGREQDLRLAQTLVKHLKSNAVCLVRDGMLVGAGAGQMSRVDSARIAVEKAGERARGAVAGSDAFFPFPDGVLVLAAAGVVAVAQPGGSRRDEEVTRAAAAQGVCMVHTGRRHFRH